MDKKKQSWQGDILTMWDYLSKPTAGLWGLHFKKQIPLAKSRIFASDNGPGIIVENCTDQKSQQTLFAVTHSDHCFSNTGLVVLRTSWCSYHK